MSRPVSEIIRRVQEASSKAGAPASNAETAPHNWEENYFSQLAGGALSPTALQVLKTDAAYIVRSCVFGDGEPGSAESEWPENRVRRGLVLGSVQSGKTASMLAVTAGSLDAGIHIVIILAGTRLALWRQTTERTVSQLDSWQGETGVETLSRRVLMPRAELLAERGSRPPLAELYFEAPNRVRKALCDGTPLLGLVMKQSDHLMRFAEWLKNTIDKTMIRFDGSLHMLVIDDEADDGSILDSRVEQGLEPDSDQRKQIPRHIARLWSGGENPNTTYHPSLYATYLAYTATPQANFLQEDHNPLAPTEFAVALRTPSDVGKVQGKRDVSFTEPDGLARYYTGGEVFYRRLGDGPGSVIVPAEFPSRNDFDTNEEHERSVDNIRIQHLCDALRGFLVAVASRLLITGNTYSQARECQGSDIEALRAVLPDPMSALVHPSSRQEEHVRYAEIISVWSGGHDPLDYEEAHVTRDPNGMPVFNLEGMRQRLRDEPELWMEWIAEYEATRQRLSTWAGGAGAVSIGPANWEVIQQLLHDEVLPQVRLSIINSDPDVDDRPRYNSYQNEDGEWQVPRDVLTVFVSGNVMSRGLTLEGLVTTVFYRASNQPAADTQMQMQRWFGYRGKILRWCRVFMFDDQYTLFKEYHEADTALRTELIGVMNADERDASTPTVLQGYGYNATAKIANTRALPLCPGAVPFLRPIERGRFAQANAELLARCLDEGQWEEVSVHGTSRGIIRSDSQFSLLEVAGILDQFRYSHHDPDPKLEQHRRWGSFDNAMSLNEPLFRPPGHLEERYDLVQPRGCPYSVAAYLRLWDAALRRREQARGLYPTDDRSTPWNLIDLREYVRDAPRFYMGVRFGPEGPSNIPRLQEHRIQRLTRSVSDGVLAASWGTRNPGEGQDVYLGDQFFDYHHHGVAPPILTPGEPPWRPRGHPGLVLFHVVKGTGNEPDAVTVGLAIPLGGPDHFAALRPTRHAAR